MPNISDIGILSSAVIPDINSVTFAAPKPIKRPSLFESAGRSFYPVTNDASFGPNVLRVFAKPDGHKKARSRRGWIGASDKAQEKALLAHAERARLDKLALRKQANHAQHVEWMMDRAYLMPADQRMGFFTDDPQLSPAEVTQCMDRCAIYDEMQAIDKTEAERLGQPFAA